jgi:hypothetical protein
MLATATEDVQTCTNTPIERGNSRPLSQHGAPLVPQGTSTAPEGKTPQTNKSLYYNYKSQL